METKTIKGGLTLRGEISAISSKSHLHRLIICGCLSDKGCKIKYSSSLSKDIEATISCLTALGANINIIDDVIEIVNPIDKNNVPESSILNCNESGSTARFMLPLAAILSKGATLYGEGKLPQRPFEQLCNSLEKAGAKFNQRNIPITVQENAKPAGFYEIGGNISSQYLTGLLFTLPLCNAEGIKLTTELESYGYVNMTIDAMNMFGAGVELCENTYTAKGNYKTPEKELINAEGDWSNSAFWLCGAKDKDITVTGLNLNSKQPDIEIISVLRHMGAKVVTSGDIVTVCAPNGTKGSSFDARNFPDLVPILAVRAAISQGETVISGVRRLRIKESDRVKSVCDMINSLGGCAFSDDDHIYIKGVKSLKGGKVDSCNDHRIAMAAAIAASFCENDVEIINPNAASKSYPCFYKHFDAMTKEL